MSIIVNFLLNKNTLVPSYKNIKKSRSFCFAQKNAVCCIGGQNKISRWGVFVFVFLEEAAGSHHLTATLTAVFFADIISYLIVEVFYGAEETRAAFLKSIEGVTCSGG